MKKLKWYVIVPSLVITWALSLSIGIFPFINEFQLFVNNGFCRITSSATLYHVSISFFLSSSVVGSGIIVFFSIVTYRFLKKNTLEGNVEVKKAVSKNLFFLAVAAVVTAIFQIFPSFSPLIRSILPDYRYFIAYNYFLRVFLNFPNIATPIVAIIALKPVKLAMKNIFKKIFKRNSAIAPEPSSTNTEP